VVYPTINFRFSNNFDFPIVLHETVKNGRVRGEILGPRRELTVTLIRRIDAAIAYEQVERPDPGLPDGERVLAQRGIPGFKLHRYRIVRRRNHAVRERYDDVYPPTTQIIRVGTGGADRRGSPKQDDPAPEYLADELLVTTQDSSGTATDADEGQDQDGMRQWREPGKYGTRGWTEQAGMPVWQPHDEADEAE
jgi:hypothetical protein